MINTNESPIIMTFRWRMHAHLVNTIIPTWLKGINIVQAKRLKQRGWWETVKWVASAAYIFTLRTIWVMDRLRTIWGLDAGQMFALGREPKRTQTRGRDDTALLLTLARKKNTWFDIIHSSYVCQNAPPFSSDLCAQIRGSTADGPAGETAPRGSPEHRNHRRQHRYVTTSMSSTHIKRHRTVILSFTSFASHSRFGR